MMGCALGRRAESGDWEKCFKMGEKNSKAALGHPGTKAFWVFAVPLMVPGLHINSLGAPGSPKAQLVTKRQQDVLSWVSSLPFLVPKFPVCSRKARPPATPA